MLFCSQILAQLINYDAADFILHFKDVGQISVIIFTPDMIAVGCIYQLRGNAYSISGLANAAFQNFINMKLNSDFPNINILSLEREG